MNDGAERKSRDYRDQRREEDDAECAHDLLVGLAGDQQTDQRHGHLGGRDHDALVDQAEAAAQLEQPDRDGEDRESDPADPAHPAAIPG